MDSNKLHQNELITLAFPGDTRTLKIQKLTIMFNSPAYKFALQQADKPSQITINTGSYEIFEKVIE